MTRTQGRTRLGRIAVGSGCPVRISAAINVSPESFYKKSVATTPKEIEAVALSATEEGADLLDVGGMSSAPYLDHHVSVGEETERVVSAIRLMRDLTDLPISIDTQRAAVAQAAVNVGATIVNDVSGLLSDPSMAKAVSELGVSLIITAREIKPHEGSPLEGVIIALRKSLGICRSNGVDPDKVVVDPGIGFFRDERIPWYQRDVEVLRDLRGLEDLGRPIHVGLSRKSFIGELLSQKEPAERLHGSLAATAIAVYNGADVIRTHDVKETVEVVRLSERIAGRRY